MITIEQYKQIQKYKELGLSINKTAKAMRLSVSSVRSYWNFREDEFQILLQKRGNTIENYRQYIIDLIHLTPQISSTRIYAKIQEEYPEFNCSKTVFFEYVKRVRAEIGIEKKKSRTTTMRAECSPGVEAQVDFGQYRMKNMYGNNVKIYFFVMILTYSRMKFVYFSPQPFTTWTAIEAHEYAFKYFGGRTKIILYDQDRVFVVSENYGNIVLVKEFEKYVLEKGYSVCLCRGADPQTKGKVENAVNVVKRSFLDGRIFYGIDRLNSECLEWLDNVENKKINYITRKQPNIMFADEIKSLVKVSEYKNYKSKILKTRRGCVTYKENLYEIPIDFVVEDMLIRAEEKKNKLLLYDAITDNLLYEHKLSTEVGKIVKCENIERAISAPEISVRKFFTKNTAALRYIDTMKTKYPRYSYTLFSNLNRLTLCYSINQINEAFDFCNGIADYNIGTLIGYLIYRNGTSEFNEYCKHQKKSNKSYYLNIANRLRSELDGRSI